MTPTTKIVNAVTVVASTSPCLSVNVSTRTPADSSTAVRVRCACLTVAHAQNATAGTSTASRKGQPERRGSSANRCAMPTPNGFIGLNDEPMPAAPRLIDTVVSASKPTPRVSTSNIGIRAMISSHMPSAAPPAANTMHAAGMISVSRRASLLASHATPPRSAPVLSTTLTAAPARKTMARTPAASMMPFGTATRASKGLTGLGSTRWYEPATTTLRPVFGSSRRSNCPAGTT